MDWGSVFCPLPVHQTQEQRKCIIGMLDIMFDRNQTSQNVVPSNIVYHAGQMSKTCFIKQCWMMFYGNVLLVWPTALKLRYITNCGMLFLVMGFISLVDDIQFMLISRHHICIRSVH